MSLVSAMEGDHGGCKLGMAQGALDQAGMHPGCEEMRGVRRPEGVDGHAQCGHAGPMCGKTAGPLDATPMQRGTGGWTVLVIAPGSRKEPRGVPMGFPVRTEQRQGFGGQGDVPVFGALAAVDMDLKAVAVDVGDVQEEGVMEPEAHAVDGGEGDLVVQRGGGGQEARDLLHTEAGREPMGGVRTQEREGVPVALEDVLREEADATGAETHGRGGEAVDVFAMQEVTLQLRFCEAVGGLVGALSQEADFPERGCLSPFAFATAVKSCKHVLTQWGHEMSPFMRCVVCL